MLCIAENDFQLLSHGGVVGELGGVGRNPMRIPKLNVIVGNNTGIGHDLHSGSPERVRQAGLLQPGINRTVGGNPEFDSFGSPPIASICPIEFPAPY